MDEAIVELLVSEGAARMPHAGDRTLLEHLLGTTEILRRWGQPTPIRRAGLLHSVYGTDAYHRQLIPPSRRAAVAAVAGEEAERLAYLFGIVPREPLFAGMHRWARSLPLLADVDPPPTRAELDALVVVHMANLADQADRRSSRWLGRLAQLADLLRDSTAVTLPSFGAGLSGLIEDDASTWLPASIRGPAIDDDAGRARFQRYVETLGTGEGPPSGAIYPDLPSTPWHDSGAFPLCGVLEANFDAIRDELLALPGRLFQPESERIDRTGEWDVAFLYERGRRHDEALAACPVTASAIESRATVRAMAGLIYVSRMRPGTHIEAHRGPTNLRLRCHLGLVIPDGDCAIRVGDQTRRWETGRCMVFDDHFEHEAWNHTDEDRIVLIVDVWHPGLSELEVDRLEGLHAYVAFHTRRLSRYWSTNVTARAAAQARVR